MCPCHSFSWCHYCYYGYILPHNIGQFAPNVTIKSFPFTSAAIFQNFSPQLYLPTIPLVITVTCAFSSDVYQLVSHGCISWWHGTVLFPHVSGMTPFVFLLFLSFQLAKNGHYITICGILTSLLFLPFYKSVHSSCKWLYNFSRQHPCSTKFPAHFGKTYPKYPRSQDFLASSFWSLIAVCKIQSSIFAYSKQSKTGAGNGLGTRLIQSVC